MSRDSKWQGLRQAVAGFGVIVVGVVVALAADEWMEDLDDDRQAAVLTARFIADIQADSGRIEQFITRASTGEAVISRFLLELELGVTVPSDSVREVIRGLASEPTLPEVHRATYVETTSTGSLGLLPERVRSIVIDYYEHVDWVASNMPQVSADLAPPWVFELPSDFLTDPNAETSSEQIRAAVRSSPTLVQDVRKQGLRHVFYLVIYQQFLDRAEAALRALRDPHQNTGSEAGTR